MNIPSTVLRSTPENVASIFSREIMGAYNSDLVASMNRASDQLGKALESSATHGWGATPKTQVNRALEALGSMNPETFASSDARQATVFARELAANTLAGRQGNAIEVQAFRSTALHQARAAVDLAAMKETMALAWP